MVLDEPKAEKNENPDKIRNFLGTGNETKRAERTKGHPRVYIGCEVFWGHFSEISGFGFDGTGTDFSQLSYVNDVMHMTKFHLFIFSSFFKTTRSLFHLFIFSSFLKRRLHLFIFSSFHLFIFSSFHLF